MTLVEEDAINNSFNRLINCSVTKDNIGTLAA